MIDIGKTFVIFTRISYPAALKFAKIILCVSYTNLSTELMFLGMRQHGHLKKYPEELSKLKRILLMKGNFQDKIM